MKVYGVDISEHLIKEITSKLRSQRGYSAGLLVCEHTLTEFSDTNVIERAVGRIIQAERKAGRIVRYTDRLWRGVKP